MTPEALKSDVSGSMSNAFRPGRSTKKYYLCVEDHFEVKLLHPAPSRTPSPCHGAAAKMAFIAVFNLTADQVIQFDVRIKLRSVGIGWRDSPDKNAYL